MTILDRQFNQRRPAAQDAATRTGLAGLLAGTLEPGALARVVLGVQAEPAPPFLGGARACRDCGSSIINPLRSQPLRCRTCGSAKRRQHNQRYQAQVEAELAAYEQRTPQEVA